MRSTAALLLIGSEIANGTVQDRHAKVLSSRLSAVGIHVHSICIVGDGEEIEGEIRRFSGPDRKGEVDHDGNGVSNTGIAFRRYFFKHCRTRGILENKS